MPHLVGEGLYQEDAEVMRPVEVQERGPENDYQGGIVELTPRGDQ